MNEKKEECKKKVYILEFDEKDFCHDFYEVVNGKTKKKLENGIMVNYLELIIADAKIEDFEEQEIPKQPLTIYVQKILRYRDWKIVLRLAPDYVEALLKQNPKARIFSQRLPIIRSVLEKRIEEISSP